MNCPTYISLFSSAGVGCYGFKMSGFECIATNELIERRLNIQRINNKCLYDTGYISGDITIPDTKDKIYTEILRWHKKIEDTVDVLIATPPCQGMSVANHKKSINEIERNSLVVESVEMVKNIKPKFFIFENVPAFMSTCCVDKLDNIKSIQDMIMDELSNFYSIYHKVINFKNYGSNSSRKRTLVIGVCKKYSDYISPIELFPDYQEETTLRDNISHLPTLQWGEFSEDDFYHQFRTYNPRMRDWIHYIEEGQSAFDNILEERKPHKVIDGRIVLNANKNSDKYTRMYWDKVCPCIHTRNDQLASQSTIHPEQDRVLSIRELMILMTIPSDFRWIDMSLNELNDFSSEQKLNLLKIHEMNIRQSIGEAVPTNIFKQISEKIFKFLNSKSFKENQLNEINLKYNLQENLLEFINNNPENYNLSSLSRIVELTNNKRIENSAYYTNKSIINEIALELPLIKKDIIRILEPSVGVGNFIPYICKYYDGKAIEIDVFDIDENILKLCKALLDKYEFSEKVTINYIQHDFLTYQFEKHYDLVIGNPPFTKSNDKHLLGIYKKNVVNTKTNNLFSYFLEKSISLGDFVVMITPKNILNTPEFEITRDILNNKSVEVIMDFGERGFKGVLIETICLFLNNNVKPKNTKVVSLTKNQQIIKKQSYITDRKFPYWLIYRNAEFDSIANNMEFDIFNVFRDRQITNSNLSFVETNDSIRVIRSRNISDTGEDILDISGYDAYILQSTAENLSVYKYLNSDNVYLTPNMTYKPRVIKKPINTLVNGSVAILIPKNDIGITEEDLLYYASAEFRYFYSIARNYQTRSLNIDSTSVFFFGIKI